MDRKILTDALDRVEAQIENYLTCFADGGYVVGRELKGLMRLHEFLRARLADVGGRIENGTEISVSETEAKLVAARLGYRTTTPPVRELSDGGAA